MEPINPKLQALKRERRNLNAKIKTVDGSIFRGVIHLRKSLNRLKDEINEDEEPVLAATNVYDQQGNIFEYTFLVPYENIVYLAIDDPDYEAQHKSAETRRMDSRILQKRKVKCLLRLVDRTVLNCHLYVRNTVFRAKDEINAKEGRFIVIADVQEPNARPEDKNLVYFINKQHVVFYAVSDDRIEK